MTPIVVAALALILIVIAARTQNYLLAVANATILAYELTAPLLADQTELYPVVFALQAYAVFASPENVSRHMFAVVLLLISVNGTYGLALWLRGTFGSVLPQALPELEAPRSKDTLQAFDGVLIALLVCGIISVATGAGSLRLNDYLGYDMYVTPFYSYGAQLLVVVGPIAHHAIRRRAWGRLVLLVAMAAPISLEIFVSSRLQWFAPLAAYLLLYLIYSGLTVRRIVGASIATVAMLFVLAMQAAMRVQVTGQDLTYADNMLFIAAQLGEFVAIGTTSMASISLASDSYQTNFLQFVSMGLANAVPYLKFGDMLFADFNNQLIGTFEMIAPAGGLSIIAEAFMSLGFTGVFIVGCFLGPLVYVGHRVWRGFVTAGPGELRVYGVAIVSLLAVKYRSGFTDMLLSFVNFSILYFASIAFYSVLVRRGGFAARRGELRKV